MKKISSLMLIIFVSLFAYTSTLSNNFVLASNDDNIRICHATGSSSNPYTSIMVDDDSIDGDGNSDHNRSGHQNGQDIIPPGYWDSNGRNWTTQNQAIWANNCNAVVPTATPTNAPQPTVTPTPTTVQQNPTATPTPTTPVVIPTVVVPTVILPTINIPTECPVDANNCEIGNIYPTQACCTTPTPTVTPDPTSTPVPTTAPTSAQSNGGTGGGSSSSTNSTAASTSASTGNVLGATTLPATGTFMNSLMDALLIAGLSLVVLSQKKYAPKKA